jgi:hypothetical protein
MAALEAVLTRVRAALAEYGLLLESDRNLPSVATLTVGAPVAGSWWSHPLSHTIYAVTRELARDRRSVSVKLIQGKVTWVDRTLWPALLAVACAREPWQMQALPDEARRLFAEVIRRGEMVTGEKRTPARELEKVLLIHSADIHTASGAHARQLESWERWMEKRRYRPKKIAPALAKSTLEGAFLRLPGASPDMRSLPWQKMAGRRRLAVAKLVKAEA